MTAPTPAPALDWPDMEALRRAFGSDYRAAIFDVPQPRHHQAGVDHGSYLGGLAGYATADDVLAAAQLVCPEGGSVWIVQGGSRVGSWADPRLAGLPVGDAMAEAWTPRTGEDVEREAAKRRHPANLPPPKEVV